MNIQNIRNSSKHVQVDSFSDGLAFVGNVRYVPFFWNEIDIVKGYYIDKTGNMVVNTNQYYNSYLFSEGLSRVEDEHHHYGYIDKIVKEVIGLKYTYAEDFSEGFAIVCTDNNHCGYIDKTGKMKIKVFK